MCSNIGSSSCSRVLATWSKQTKLIAIDRLELNKIYGTIEAWRSSANRRRASYAVYLDGIVLKPEGLTAAAMGGGREKFEETIGLDALGSHGGENGGRDTVGQNGFPRPPGNAGSA